MPQHWTDFREYRLGRRPGDMTARWATTTTYLTEGAASDLAERNYLSHTNSTDTSNTALSWNAPDQDGGFANQEVLRLCQVYSRSSATESFLRFILRGSGTTSATASGYLFVASTVSGSNSAIFRVVNNVFTSLGTSSKFFPDGTFVFMRCRVSGTSPNITLNLKLWAFGDTEPAGWDITVTGETQFASGWLGVMDRNSGVTVRDIYLSVGTNGDTAPSYSSRDESLLAWIKEDDEPLDIVARCEYYNPTSDMVEETWLCEKYGRTTAYADFPSNVHVRPLITDPGTLSSKLEADVPLAAVTLPELGALRFSNSPYTPGDIGPLEPWIRYSFHGRPIELRVGKVWRTKPTATADGILNPLRRYEIVGCALAASEPDVGLDQVTLPTGPVDALLKDRVTVYRNVGIATGVKTLSTAGFISVPTNAAYDTRELDIKFRFILPTGGIAGAGTSRLSQRGVSPNRQWGVMMGHASHATLANQLIFVVDDGTTAIINMSSTTQYNDGLIHSVILAYSDVNNLYYILIDGRVFSAGAMTGVPIIATGVAPVINNAPGVTVFDSRYEKYTPQDEALARFSSRRDPDSLTLSMHRCDDNTGNTVTDYATLANHGTLQGSDGIDRSWSATYAGGAELAGVAMPFSGGVLYHAPTQPIDSVREIFRYNDRAKTTGAALQIRAKGLVLTGGGVSYSEPADGVGTADIVGASDQPITYGLTVSGSPENERIHVPRLVRDELISRGVLSASTCEQESFAALRRLLPMKGGFHYQDPPSVSDFLSQQLGPIGCHYLLDRSARVAAGMLLPPVNPGPYGLESLLEFLGYTAGGVAFSDHSSYRLTQSASDFGLLCWFKLPHKFIRDLTVTTTGDYSQPGYTLIDKMAGGTSGYYLGLDRNTGALRFAAGGIDFGGGLHYYILGDYNTWPQRVWCAVSASVQNGVAWLDVQTYEGGVARTLVSGVVPITGSLTDSPNIPLRIGHGPQGPFVGSICYVIGCSPAQDPPSFNPLLDDEGPQTTFGTDRFKIYLNDGSSDSTVMETVQSRQGLISSGVRWCPKLTMDFRAAASPSVSGVRRSLPAWRVESRYKENRQSLSGTNVAAGVSASDRIALGQPHLSESDSLQDTKTDYLNSRDLSLSSLSSPLLSQNDADLLSHVLMNRLSNDRRFAIAKNWYREMLSLNLTDEVHIYHDSFDDVDTGRAVRVAGALTARLNEWSGDIDMWG